VEVWGQETGPCTQAGWIKRPAKRAAETAGRPKSSSYDPSQWGARSFASSSSNIQGRRSVPRDPRSLFNRGAPPRATRPLRLPGPVPGLIHALYAAPRGVQRELPFPGHPSLRASAPFRKFFHRTNTDGRTRVPWSSQSHPWLCDDSLQAPKARNEALFPRRSAHRQVREHAIPGVPSVAFRKSATVQKLLESNTREPAPAAARRGGQGRHP